MSCRLVLRFRWNLYSSPENILYFQSNQNSVTECLALSMGVCSQKSFHCAGAGLFSRLMSFWVSEPEVAPWRHVHKVLEVHSMKHFAWEVHFTCTGSACFVVAVIDTGLEGVVVLKGDEDSGIVLELHWLCTAHCGFHMSSNIWNTFNVLFDVPFDVPFLNCLYSFYWNEAHFLLSPLCLEGNLEVVHPSWRLHHSWEDWVSHWHLWLRKCSSTFTPELQVSVELS